MHASLTRSGSWQQLKQPCILKQQVRRHKTSRQSFNLSSFVASSLSWLALRALSRQNSNHLLWRSTRTCQVHCVQQCKAFWRVYGFTVEKNFLVHTLLTVEHLVIASTQGFSPVSWTSTYAITNDDAIGSVSVCPLVWDFSRDLPYKDTTILAEMVHLLTRSIGDVTFSKGALRSGPAYASGKNYWFTWGMCSWP
jgi:hypothetical protein